jgi:hypothetical protein
MSMLVAMSSPIARSAGLGMTLSGSEWKPA